MPANSGGLLSIAESDLVNGLGSAPWFVIIVNDFKWLSDYSATVRNPSTVPFLAKSKGTICSAEHKTEKIVTNI
jgi:hypothetical protein